MKCRIENIKSPRLQELINKFGQKDGLLAYVNEKTGVTSEDLLIEGSEQKFKPKEQDRINREKQKLAKLKEDLKKADKATSKKLNADIQKQEVLINDLEEQLERFLREKSLPDIYQQAELNLADIERIFEQDEISYEELEHIRSVSRFWQAAGIFNEGEEHLFLDEDEANSPEIQQRFIQYKNTAEKYIGKYLNLAKQKLTSDYNSINNANLKPEELFKVHKDSWKITSEVLNLGEQGHALTDMIYKTVEQIKLLSEEETYNKITKLTQLYKEAEPELKTIQKTLGNNTIWDVFRQKKANNRETGNTTFRFSQDFFDAEKALIGKTRKLNREISLAKDEKEKQILRNGLKKAWADFYNWVEENTITIDVRMLFPDKSIEDSEVPEEYIYKRKTYADNIIDQHKEDLKQQLGEKGFEQYMEVQQKLVNSYFQAREAAWYNIQEQEDLTEDQKKLEFETWIKENSPYWSLDMKESPAMRTKNDGSYYNSSFQYNKSIPRRFVNNQETGWYDKNFDLIQKYDKAAEFYDYAMELMNENRDIFGVRSKDLQMNSIPYIKNQIIDTLMERGITSAGYGIWNKVIESLRTDDLSTTDYSETDPLTGESKKQLQINILNSKSKEVQDYVDLKVAQYKVENKSNPDYATIKNFREEAIDKLSKEKSFDLLRILEAYTIAAMSYKNKIAVEPFVRTADNLFKTIKKEETNRAGGVLYKGLKPKIGSESLDSIQAALSFYLDERFWNYPTKKISGQTDKKVFTTEEKKVKKELEETIEQLKSTIETTEGEEAKSKLQEDLGKLETQLEELGGKVTVSNVVEDVLKLVHVKGMGYNVRGATTNLLVGKITNWVQAADGRFFNHKELRKGENIGLQSMLKSVTFNKTATKDAKKLRAIVDRFNFLSRSSDEIYKKEIQSTLTKGLKNISPYNLTNIAEYQIQAPLLAAMMFHDKIWESLDQDGNIKEDSDLSQKELIDFILKARRLRDSIHGDYTNPLKGQSTIWGKALMMYRRWLFSTFANRFRAEKYDDLLKTDVKGRYRSGIGFISYSQSTGMNAFKQTLATLKYLLRKSSFRLLYKNYSLEEQGFSELDAANIRKNLQELIILVSLLSMTLMLKAIVPDDDEEDKRLQRASLLFLANQGNRLQTDIMMYVNPMEFEKINKSIIPGFQLIRDVNKWGDAAIAQLGEHPELESGTFEGMNKLTKTTLEALPLTSAGMSLYKSGSYLIREK